LHTSTSTSTASGVAGGVGGGRGPQHHHHHHNNGAAAGPRHGAAAAAPPFYRRGAPHAPTPGTPGRVWLELKEEELKKAEAKAKATATAEAATATTATTTTTTTTTGEESTPPLRPLPLRFRTFFYNCLADELAYAHAAELYRAVPRDLLSWPGRLAGLVAEIAHWRPSICLLQEVDRPDDVRGELSKLGYKAKHAPRTGGRSDGCLTAYKRAEFDLVHSETIAMADHGLRDNVALLLVLRPKQQGTQVQQQQGGGNASAPATAVASSSSSSATAEKKEGEEEEAKTSPSQPSPQPSRLLPPHAPILVANTHLLFNPKRGDVKLAQARTLLAKAAAVASKFAVGHALLGGDFNATPGSAVYEFVSGGELRDFAALDRRVLSRQLVGGAGGQGSFTGGVGGGVGGISPFATHAYASTSSPAAHVLKAEDEVAARFPLFASVRDQAAGRYGGGMRQQQQQQQQQGPNAAPPPPPPPHPAAGKGEEGEKEEGRDVDTDGEFEEEDDDGDEMETSSASSPSKQGKKKKSKKAAKGESSSGGDGGKEELAEVDAAVSVIEVEMTTTTSSTTPSSTEQGSGDNAAKASSATRHPASISGTWTLEQLHMVIGTAPPGSSAPQENGGNDHQQNGGVSKKKPTSSSSEANLDAAASAAAAQINNSTDDNDNSSDPSSWVAKHPLSLQSAYRSVAGAEPAFTSAHGGFVGTVDYLWFTPESLLTEEAIRVLEQKNRQLATRRANKRAAEAAEAAAAATAAKAAAEGKGEADASAANSSPKPPPSSSTTPAAIELPPLPPVPQRTTLTAVAALAPPPLASLPQGLPSASFPSDHVAVVVDFVVR